MDIEFGSNMSYSALENVIAKARIETKNVNDALDMVLDLIKINYTYKGE